MTLANLMSSKLSEMARGVLVVDENLKGIEPFLIKRNIRVVIPESGMKDQKIKETILPHRIFITNNAKDFIDDIISYEYGIISTDNLKSKDPENLAKLISDVIIKYSLWSVHQFVITLKNDGNHEF
ncbi:MAG: hypothetical protein HQK93_09625, partial [Nitrospirae bacterium]|nr:hypothetical protein [Nitrospirota bacterium]